MTATDGAIAVLNLEGARRKAWRRFAQDPHRIGVAEAIVEMEQLAAQHLGDLGAFDRLEALASSLARMDGGSARTALVEARVASTTHRFADARRHLAEAAQRGTSPEDVHRQTLSVDQACGDGLDGVLDARRRLAASTGTLEDLVPLGALLADLGRVDEADRVYRQALGAYGDVSPFPLVWACFQLGMLWGEVAPNPEPDRAAAWYERAVGTLPACVRARVHLAEILATAGRFDDAERMLVPALASRDPEVRWRLADVLSAQGRTDEARDHLAAARAGFEDLLARHPLAFADHAAEFYAGSGDDPGRALVLARMNVENRPTRRAQEQLRAACGRTDAHRP